MKKNVGYLIALFALTFQACQNTTGSSVQQADPIVHKQIDSLKRRISLLEKNSLPGIGPTMLTIQTHHTKLGLAMHKENWTLSQFELEEIEEDFIRLGELYPSDKGFNLSTEEYIKNYIAPAIERLEEACKNKDVKEMNSGYKLLTAGCNSCHHETKHSFNVIIDPVQSAFPDQQFNKESD